MSKLSILNFEDLRPMFESEEKLNAFLGTDYNQKAAKFEFLVGCAFSRIMSIPLYSKVDEKKYVVPRILWRGYIDENGIYRTADEADLILYLKGSRITIEVTRTTNNKQHVQEYSTLTNNMKKFRAEKAIFVCQKLANKMYTTLRDNEEEDIVPLETRHLAKMMELEILSGYGLYYKLNKLLTGLRNELKNSSSVSDYSDEANEIIDKWVKELLKDFKRIILAEVVYKIIKTRNHDHVGLSEISNYINENSKLNSLFETLGIDPLKYSNEIGDAINSYIVAHIDGLSDGDIVYTPIEWTSIEKRMKSFLEKIKGTF